MSKELVIASNRHETKVAILEDDQLVEVYFQRSNEYSLAGSIHKGRVTRVLPGMQSAFVDLGLERDTFLYVSDFFEEHDDIDTVSEEKTSSGPGNGRRREGRNPNEDRRERGDRYRNQQPAQGFQAQPPRMAEASSVVEPPADFAETALPVQAFASEEPVAAEATLPGEVIATSESPAPFRNDNRQDNDRRRGRRSRRRRGRGGEGIPENKYAQASALNSPEALDEAEGADIDDEPEVVGAENTAPLILPGESLAKYRRVERPGGIAHAEQANAVEAAGPEEDEVEARAEELETADRILSHHVAEPIAVEEAKIAEVRSEAEVSPFLATDLAEDDEQEEELPTEASAEIRESAHVEALRFDSGAETVELPEHPVAEGDAIAEGEELPVEELAEDSGVDTSAEELAGATDFDGADLEDLVASLESDDEQSAESASGDAGSNTPEGRTDEREGGDRMRRGPRRMRRRRGGNRFGGGDRREQAPQGQAREEFTAATPVAPLAAVAAGAAPRQESRSGDRSERVLPSISDLLKPGQELIVQIAKEPLGQKGARITSHIALPGRYVVFMPSVNHLGVSRKVESDEERQRLKRILQAHRVGTTGGFIVRTAGEGVPEPEIAADMQFLYKLWLDIKAKAEKKPAPALLHCDLDIVQRILRDQVTEDFKSIWVDNEEMYESALSFVQRFQPTLVGRVKMYTREAPIFDAFNITQELEKALRPKVWLKSGGYIVINQTEALVAIDINTGKYVGKSNRLEDTIAKTNLEAVKEIVRQIRLRDLGGIIVVDFIDMDERKNRQKVMQALEEAMQSDKAPYKILQFNDFGLVAITRKRVKQSLERTMCSPCPYCEGAGYVKSVQTIIGEILAEAQKIRKAIDRDDVILRVNPEVAKVLKASDNRYLEEIEEILGRPVLVKGDPALHTEKYDLG